MTEFSNIVVTEGTVSEPVSLAEAKEWIGGLEGITDFDSLITSSIKATRQFFERTLNISLVNKSITLDIKTACDDSLVMLPYSKTVGNVQVNSLDSDGTSTLIETPDDYLLRGNILTLPQGFYSVSYDVVATVPEDLKEVIKMEVTEKFKHRGENNQGAGISEAARQRAQAHLIPWL